LARNVIVSTRKILKILKPDIEFWVSLSKEQQKMFLIVSNYTDEHLLDDPNFYFNQKTVNFIKEMLGFEKF
jgi:hypothetical protein